MSALRMCGAVALACAMAVAGCDCDAAKLKHRTVIDDMSVQAHGGVSCGGEPVRLRAIVFGGVPPFTYEWSPSVGMDDPTSASPLVEADQAREYTVRVIDDQGLEKIGTATVGRGGPPTPSLGFRQGDALTCAGDTVELDASKSVDRSGLPVRYYSWQLGDAAPRVGPESSSGAFVPTDGQKVTLIVTDASGCSASLEQVLQVRQRPVVNVSFAQGNDFVCQGDAVALAATAVDADGAEPESFGWDLDGDTTTFEIPTLSTGSFQPTGAPATFVAIDSMGCDSSVSTDIEVHPVPKPGIRIVQGAAQVCEGALVTFDGATSTDGLGGAVANYAWDLDGNPATIESTLPSPPAVVATGTREVSLTVTDAKGCSATTTQPLDARPLPLADLSFVQGRADACQGDAVQVSAQNSVDADGLPVSTVEWDFNLDGTIDSQVATPDAWVPTGSSLVRLTVTDSFGCVATASTPVSPRALPQPKLAFASGESSTCVGTSVSLDASGSRDADGQPVALYAWDLDGDATTTELSSASTGEFEPTGNVRLEVTDAMGCRASVVQPLLMLEGPEARIAFTSGDESVCAGDVIALDASASVAPASSPIVAYRWDFDGDGQDDAQGPTPASFPASTTYPVRLTVESANGCTSDAAVTVSARALPTAELAFVEGRADACLGDAVALSAAGSLDADGNPITTFQWTYADAPAGLTAAVTPSFVPTTSQLVAVKVIDAQGCSAQASRSLAPRALPVPVLSFDEGAAQVCSGDGVALDAGATVDADGQAVSSFAWELDGDSTTIESFSSTTGRFVPQGQPARLSVVDRFGCIGRVEQPLAVRQRPVPRVTFATGADAVCANDEVQLDAATSTAADGAAVTRFEWDVDGDAVVDSTSSSSPTLRPQANASVRLTVYDDLGCSSALEQDIVAHPRPVPRITFAQGRADVCLGDQLALSAQTSTASGDALLTGFAWDFDGDASTVESSESMPAAFAPSAAMAARLQVTDSNGCTAEVSQPIAPRALPDARIVYLAGRANACVGDAVRFTGESSTDTDGAPVSQWAWDFDGDGADDSLLGITPELFPNDARNVTLRVTDAMGCVSQTTEPIAPRALPTPAIAFTQGASAVCAGDAVDLSAAGSRDADGNPVSAFAWSIDGRTVNAPATGAFTPTGSPVALTVTDAQGCSATATQTFDVGALPTAAISFVSGSPLVCPGASIALDASPSRDAAGNPIASFQWDLDSDGVVDGTSVSAPAFNAATSGTATLTVADARGCRASATQPVAVRGLPTARISFLAGRENACVGDAVRLGGDGSRDIDGGLVSSYSWDLDGDGVFESSGASAPAFTASTGQVAHLRVTDRLGCVGETNQVVTPRALPSAVIGFASGAPLVCDGASVGLHANASRDADGALPVAYEWDLNGDGAWEASGVSAPTFTAATATSARLRVRDALGCTSTATQPVSVQSPPTARINFLEGSSRVCSGSGVRLSGAATTDALGAPAAGWRWDLDGDGAFEFMGEVTSAFPVSTARTARLEVTDTLGCTAQATQLLDPRPLPVANAGVNGRVCAGESLTIGGAAESGLTYAWSPSDTLNDASLARPMATVTAPTTYALTVTDAFGCVGTDEVSVNVHASPIADAGMDRLVTPGASVRLLGNASGGTAALSYAWSPAATVDNASSLQPLASPPNHQDYVLSVTDANGCVATDDVHVRMVSQLTVQANNDRLFCPDGGTGVPLFADAAGGVGALTWQWTASPSCAGCIASPNASTTTVSPVVDTLFTVTATDENGTVASDTVSVTVHESGLRVNAGIDRRLRPGESTQLGAPGDAGLAYAWTCNRAECGLSDPSISNPVATPRGTTAYRVVASDGLTCTATDTVLVSTEAQILAAMPSEGFAPWPRDAPLWVVFDTEIDPSSLAGNVHLLDPTDGKSIWIDVVWDEENRMLTISPLSKCNAGTCNGDKAYWNNREYLLVIDGGMDGVTTAGALPEPLYNDITLGFLASSMGDGTAPEIAHSRPAPAATQVDTHAHVVVTFAEHVDPRTVTESTFWIDGVAAMVDYDIRTQTAVLRPASPLAPNRTYTVRIDGIIDARSSPKRLNELVASWTFTTGSVPDTTPPRVVSFVPVDGTLGYDVAAPIRVTFNEPLDAWTVSQLRLVDETTGFPLLADVLWDDATLTASFDVRGLLDSDVLLRIEASDVTDQAGNSMAGRVTSDFRTVRALVHERFESPLSGWSLQTPLDLDYQAAYTDWFGLSDTPDALQSNGLNATATLPVLDVVGRSSVLMSFFARRTLALDGDEVLVQTSPDGASWTTVGTLSGATGWRRFDYSLPTNGRAALHVRLRSVSNGSVNLDGFFLDDLVVR